MLFPDWVAITVLVLLLVGAASAWIRQHKFALMQQTKKPRFPKPHSRRMARLVLHQRAHRPTTQSTLSRTCDRGIAAPITRTSQKVRRRNGTFSKLGAEAAGSGENLI